MTFDDAAFLKHKNFLIVERGTVFTEKALATGSLMAHLGEPFRQANQRHITAEPREGLVNVGHAVQLVPLALRTGNTI